MQIDDVLVGRARPSGRVVVVAQDDHMPPLSVADHLATELRCEVRLVHQTLAPAPLVGKYTIGGVLSRLLGAGVQLVGLVRVVAIEPDRVRTRDIFSGSPGELTDVDAVVLACGREPDATLRRRLAGQVPELHVLGDAYAPRRITFPTRQAWALARAL